MTLFEEIKIKISPGDVIRSKNGILSESPLTGKFYLPFGSDEGDGKTPSFR